MMKLTDVFDKLTTLYYKPFSELKHQEELSNFTINKGNTGQFLQQLLDMPNNSNLTDFEDGELKTNKADSTGTPKETMFITQISQDFDSLFFSEHLNNRLLQKISNLLYLPVCKTSPSPNDWYFLPAYHIDARINPQLIEIYTQDYLSIKNQILYHLEHANDHYIHTSSGKYIQIRSKDAKRANGQYNPIFSKHLNRYVSDKNHAFYFKRDFMLDMQNGTLAAQRII